MKSVVFVIKCILFFPWLKLYLELNQSHAVSAEDYYFFKSPVMELIRLKKAKMLKQDSCNVGENFLDRLKLKRLLFPAAILPKQSLVDTGVII